jgi:putative spermidine/putrescine transport system permease protein
MVMPTITTTLQMKMIRVMEGLLLIGLLLFILLPFIPLLLGSFVKQWPWPELLPQRYSLDAWKYLFSASGRAWEGMWNSWLIALITWLFNLLLGLPAAKALAQRQFSGKGAIFALLLSPLFVPFTASVMGLHSIMIYVKQANPYLITALSHVIPTLPYFIVILWFQYRLVGTSLQEAGFSLGAKGWQVFLWIELPLIKSGFLLGSFLVVLISLSQYISTWIMSGGTLLTLPLIIFPYANSGNTSLVAAYSLWFMWPVILLMGISYLMVREK